jgi:SAM-dependent MidA family methyltransferase
MAGGTVQPPNSASNLWALTQQALFLMALGLGDRLNDLAQLTSTHPHTQTVDTLRYALQRRETLHQLINPPMGLGNFGVLIHHDGKGCLTPAALAQPLRGLTANPFPSGKGRNRPRAQ